MKARAIGCSGSDRPGKALDIERLDDAAWSKLTFQSEVLEALKPRGSKDRIAEAARVLGCSEATVYRMLGRYRRTGHIASIIPNRSSGGRGGSRLTPEQDGVLAETLKKFLRRKAGMPLTMLVSDAEDAFRHAGVPPASPRSIIRRFESLPERTRHAHRHGRSKAAQTFDIHRGETPPCSRPLERVQIDHTLADVWLVSEDRNTVIGRPWVTLAIDEFSRCVIGLVVSYKEPSSEQFASVAAQAALPKRELLERYGLGHLEWPCHGIMSVIFTDGGPDFRAHAAWRGLRKWRGSWELRERPHYGGIIESLIGTAMKQARLLPGNTARVLWADRDDRVDPSRTACLTKREFMKKLLQFFADDYMHRKHPGIEMTPFDKWQLGCHQHGEPQKVPDPHRFYLDFLPAEPRTLQKYGVLLSHLRYRSVDLQALRNMARDLTVQVKVDPADVTRAFVEHPITGEYIEVRTAPLTVPDVTREEWNHYRKKALEERAGDKIGRRTIEFSIMTGRMLERDAEFQGLPNSRAVKAGRKPGPHRSAARSRERHKDSLETSAAYLPPASPEPIHRDPVRIDPSRIRLYETSRSIP